MENQSPSAHGSTKLLIVTGGSRGIGYAIAETFAAAGYHLLLNSRNPGKLEVAAAGLKDKFPGISVNAFAADLAKKDGVIKFAEWCLSQGTPEILVNNAGDYLPGNAWNEPDGQMETMMDLNFYSAYHLTRLILPRMISNGNGHIFNMCSIAALHAYEGGGSYSISKFALNGFSQNLRHELKKTGIKVTTIFPGAVMTDTWGDFDNSKQRIMESADIARMMLAATELSSAAVVEQILLRPQLGDL